MATMQEIKTATHNQSLIRKVLDGAAVLAPYSTSMPDAWVDENGALQELPTGFAGLGIVEKDSGYEFGSDQDTEEVEGHGYSSPVRIDIVKTTRTVSFTALETNRVVLEQYHGIDLSGVKATAAGTIVFSEPENAARPYARLCLIGSDGVGEDEIFMIKEMPRVQVTEVESQSWSSSDALKYGMTMTAFADPELGYSIRNIIAGPGAKKYAQAMGFEIGA